MPIRVNPARQPVRFGIVVLATLGLVACSTNPVDPPPATIVPAEAAQSPPVTETPAGVVQPLPANARDAVFDSATGSLVVLHSDTPDQSAVTVFGQSGEPRTVSLPAPATAITADGQGTAYLSSRGGYVRFDVAGEAPTLVEITGQQDTDFTAVARRADGKLVLGSADGTVYTLRADTEVGAQVSSFTRVDQLVTQGDTTVVLDRAQTLVTTIDPGGADTGPALRAGEGATTMAADPAGRVLVTDTRGGELLVYSVNPLMLRQRYPVPDSPYGVAGAPDLAWVSQTASNTVVGYDLSTGLPVEKVRYRTVQQPNSLAFDDASGTLYVVSGSGAGVQVIADAAESHR